MNNCECGEIIDNGINECFICWMIRKEIEDLESNKDFIKDFELKKSFYEHLKKRKLKNILVSV